MKFDYNETYYKVTNKEECHNGLRYQDGLNIDPLPFNDNPEASSIPGGIYFTDAEHIFMFLHFGCFIREVNIPNDAKVIKDPDNDKWRADRVIFGRRYDFNWYFDNVFDKGKFDWVYSGYLARYCSKYFDKWFDPYIFDWDYSDSLAIYCSEYFNKWFDPDRFGWAYSGYLATYCSAHFDKWWDADKFGWNYSAYLAKYCSKYFDKWWDAEEFDWNYSDSLAKYCSKYFDKWFDPEKFDWDYSDCLAEYCSDKKNIWEKYINEEK